MKFRPYQKYRILEMIPGTLALSTLIVVLLLSFVKPLWMIYFVIIFDLYWLLRIIYFIIYLSLSWKRYQQLRGVRWMDKIQKECADWEKIRHIIFLPTVDEDIEVLRHTFQALKASTYPKDKMIVVLAGEQRRLDSFERVSQTIYKEFADCFFQLLITVHPDGVPGEVAAKGANLNYAGREVKKYIDQHGWNYDDIIVSSFDIDTVADTEYFAYLTYTYLRHPNPTRSSYQPLALYNNNVWESFSFARIVANSTTFWLMAELARPKPLWTFSSHSMSFRALADVGFWQNDIVTEDSRIFLQCFIYYDGDYEVTPLYISVSMDTAHAGTLKETVKNLYKQIRRWAWGIEHFPFMIWHFWKADLGPKKWHLVFNLAEGMYSWSTAPLLILILGYIPLWAVGDVEKTTVIAQNAPIVLEWLMRAAMVGIFASAILNVYLLPSIVPGNRFLKFFIMIVQWILLPITLIIFGSIPAIDAQTRLMTGKYLGFYTAKKFRKSKTSSIMPVSFKNE
ncbi:MAG TPA: glycosyltransferase family 2 protein [Patescibacteria group bacterium]|nr:glycosyltransferase family 2 protein [Patescibacteria group bacterium]